MPRPLPALALLLALTGPVAAASLSPDSQELFQDSDLNRDGMLDVREGDGALTRLFDRWDLNGDGQLPWAEYVAALDQKLQAALDRGEKVVFAGLEAQAQAIFKGTDRDRNGVITADEFIARNRVLFRHYDRNRDGRITLPEIAQTKQADARRHR